MQSYCRKELARALENYIGSKSYFKSRMQVSGTSLMALFSSNQDQYWYTYEGQNYIASEGCMYLAKAKWPNMS